MFSNEAQKIYRHVILGLHAQEEIKTKNKGRGGGGGPGRMNMGRGMNPGAIRPLMPPPRPQAPPKLSLDMTGTLNDLTYETWENLPKIPLN